MKFYPVAFVVGVVVGAGIAYFRSKQQGGADILQSIRGMRKS